MQEDIIRHTIAGGDSLVLMPTGGGKSLCFQISALLMKGMAVVVSPLISLMKDQVEGLRVNGIASETLNSSNDEGYNRDVINRCKDGKVKLLYISPERLVGGLIQQLQHLNVCLFAIDEAHCISSWGHDFRPEYTQLGQLKQLFTGTGIKHLTGQSLVRVQVPTVKRDMQDRIVNEIESRLSVCDSIDHIVNTALQQAEAMRQSILKDAFEGKLL